MSGPDARKGFRYQDLYLLQRVLSLVRDECARVWECPESDLLGLLAKLPHTLGVEASDTEVPGRTGELPCWDVLILTSAKREFIEVKSSAISKEDRITYWLRLRRELADASTETIEQFYPGLATSPLRNRTPLWEGVAKIAEERNAALPENDQASVSTREDLLQEALWWLCCETHRNSSGKAWKVQSGLLPLDTVLKVLSRFKADFVTEEELRNTIEAFFATLFPDSLEEPLLRQARDWIDERATHPDAPQRTFTIRDMFSEIELLRKSLAAKPGEIRKYRELWDTLPRLMASRTHGRLGQSGETFSLSRIRPDLAEVVENLSNKRILVLGTGGIGKSTLLLQIYNSRIEAGSIALCCHAEDLREDEIEDFERSLRFHISIERLRSQESNVCLVVDGLDEMDGSKRNGIVKSLARLGEIAGIQVIAGVRDSVWREDGGIRRDLEHWLQVEVPEWPEDLVSSLLKDAGIHSPPGNLLKLLRTPIYLDLFWRTCIEGDTEKEKYASIQNKHGIIAAFWEKRVLGGTRKTDVSPEDRISCLDAVCEQMSSRLEHITGSGLHTEALSVLISEGVLVCAGRT